MATYDTAANGFAQAKQTGRDDNAFIRIQLPRKKEKDGKMERWNAQGWLTSLVRLHRGVQRLCELPDDRLQVDHERKQQRHDRKRREDQKKQTERQQGVF